MDGQLWERPEAMYAAHALLTTLPMNEKAKAMMPTNDSNEGWMGANARVAKRWAPNATLEFINAKSQHYNGTAAFIADNLNTAAGQQFLQKQAQ
ncbi:hypothetical protein B0H19DRAFT_1273799 [Mycena capillaripes]|nr:hypothetical protein B0H19DRAFT_1273799 [Mycena capillaripes]